jgi:hypothetical protein
MADAVVQLPPDSSGKMLDQESLTVGANTVHRQRQQIAGALAAEIARVMNSAPAGTEYGLVVRQSGLVVIQGQQSALQTGSIIAATTVVGPFTATNYNLATVGIAGTYNGVTAVFEGSPDGTNWFTLQGQRTDSGVVETGPTALTNAIRGWDVFIGGWTSFRVRATAWTSGSATILVTFQTMPIEPAPTAIQGPAGTSPWLVTGGAATGSATFNVGVTTTSALALAANLNRRGATFTNDGTAIVYLAFGQTASATSYGVRIPPNGYYELPYGYTGAVNCIASATGTSSLRGQELT